MYYVVTGAAGFIGSNLVRALNDRGVTDIIAVDDLHRGRQVREPRRLRDRRLPRQGRVPRASGKGDFDGAVEAVLHQGACSDTTERDGRYMMRNNYDYSKALLEFCTERAMPFIYASSAAVYGARTGFRENPESEAPLNVYGYSKLLFDQYRARAVRRSAPRRSWVCAISTSTATREQHKGRMASVAFHFFNQYRATGSVRLFEGSGGYGDGEQRRDFVSVEDVVRVNLLLPRSPRALGHLQRRHRRRPELQRCRGRDASTPAGQRAAKRALTLDEMQAAGHHPLHPVSRRTWRAGTRATRRPTSRRCARPGMRRLS